MATAKIDLHHHFVPPMYTKAIEDAGGDPSGWIHPKWTSTSSQQLMERTGSSIAILSLTTPGVEIVKDKARQRALAREVNEYAANLRDSSPHTFGFFATLPSLLDVEGAIEETRYALDILKADGVTLFTRYGDANYYLGHELFIPIWKELNARKVVVFIHPTYPIAGNLVNKSLPNPIIDYTHETTRTVLDLILSSRKRENPDCKVILSHAGGTLPFVIDRAAKLLPNLSPKNEQEIKEDAKSFYCDLALSTSSISLFAVQEFFGSDRVVFGSDYPYAPEPVAMQFTEQLHEAKLGEELRRKIYTENALNLIPRLRECLTGQA